MIAREFTTPAGLIVPAITTAQMREVDRIAIEELGPNLFQMMENAGRNLALLAIDQLGSGWPGARVVVLAGSGGNGGGGICAARHLANRGIAVTVVTTGRESLGEAAAQQLEMFTATPGRIANTGEIEGLPADLVIDAVIGYSLGGAPRGAAKALIEWVRRAQAPVVSLDVPSGLDATTGDTPGAFVEAITTLTLALPKQGLASPAAGSLLVGDIGIPGGVFQRAGIMVPAGLFGAAYRVALTPRGL